ncbi:hypothetical protein [Lysinibacter sp. HNR]|uniref:hypothetical protein n=1 Tax=Lysinibacter sp. HNR TaxID=3031408 RepID=UPI002435B20C|nr:hypothetical protein [Lysinibacter sp. HNR]WGD36964.1 hypothetical protein FrondiHNR_10995 [Lysinibacter sp. HNR]
MSLAKVTDVRTTHNPARIPIGRRGPGLDFMGKLCGTFHLNGEKHFWNYSGSGVALSIKLTPDQNFQRLVLSTDSPEDIKHNILTAMSSL